MASLRTAASLFIVIAGSLRPCSAKLSALAYLAQGPAPAKLSLPLNENAQGVAGAVTSFLQQSTPDNNPADDTYEPSQYRFRNQRVAENRGLSGVDVPATQNFIPAVVNTQFVDTVPQTQVAVKRAFPGLDVSSQPNAQFRPPNQGLCVGGGYAVEVIDMVLAVYNSTTGGMMAGPTRVYTLTRRHYANQTASEINCVLTLLKYINCKVANRMVVTRHCPVGIYDVSDSKRFFVTFRTHKVEGPKLVASRFLILASASSNPLDGWVGPYEVSVDGLDPLRPGKPLRGLGKCASPNAGALPPGCLATYPMLGLDAHGLWVSFNMYQVSTRDGFGVYAGPLLLGFRKADLLAGAHLEPGRVVFHGFDADAAYTLAPSAPQAGTPHWGGQGGAVFVASTGPSLTTQAAPTSSLLVWAITQTGRLSEPGFPNAGLPEASEGVLLATGQYADPFISGVTVAQPNGAPLDAKDSRTTQLALAGPLLWTAAATAVTVNGQGAPTEGAIWWALQPGFNGSQYTPSIISQGYVSVANNHLLNPAVTANARGQAVLVAGLVGPDYHLSSGYTPLRLQLGAGAFHVTTLSQRQLQGNTADVQPGWLLNGAYSAATLDENGLAWLATEWAGADPTQACLQDNLQLAAMTTCPSYGTYVTGVDPQIWP